MLCDDTRTAVIFIIGLKPRKSGSNTNIDNLGLKRHEPQAPRDKTDKIGGQRRNARDRATNARRSSI